MSGPRLAFAIVAWLFVVSVVVQVFLAGAGLFKLMDFTAHGGLGWTIAVVPLLMLVLALLAHVDRRTGLLSLALAVLTTIQPELAASRHENPVLAAFHPVNALLIFWLAWTVARRSNELLRTST